ncbi:unnamed protein product, partial [Didymodactylos carnosus]
VNGGSEQRPSPLDIAIFKGYDEIIIFLVKHNGKKRFDIQHVVNKHNTSIDIDLNIEGLSVGSNEDTVLPQSNSIESENTSTPQKDITQMVSGNNLISRRQKNVKDWKEEIADLTRRASLHLMGNDSDSAINYYKEILELFLENTDKEHDPELGRIYNSIALAYHRKQDYSNALVNYLKALQIAVKLDNQSKIADCYANIGLIYASKKNDVAALENFEKALVIRCSIPAENIMETGRLEKYIGIIKSSKKI